MYNIKVYNKTHWWNPYIWTFGYFFNRISLVIKFGSPDFILQLKKKNTTA